MPESNSVALVTGAGVRLGSASARALAARGTSVALHYRSSVEGVETLAQELQGRGVDCAIFQADLSDPSAYQALIQEVDERFGRLDILVNNSGIYEASSFENVSLEDFDKVVAINLRAPFFLTQSALPLLRRSHGCVINLTDTDVGAPYPGYAHYFASKGGLEVLTAALATELGPEVRVNAIGPGTVAVPVGMSEEEGQALGAAVPLRRVGEPEDVAKAVAYLAFDAPYVTGQVIRVDGGRVTR